MTYFEATLRKISDWGPDAVGSTRPAGMMRMALGLIAFVRFGSEFAPWNANTPIDLGLGIIFFYFAVCAVLGIHSRRAIAGLGITVMGLYALSVMRLAPLEWSHHHVYLLGISCLLLSLTECGRSFSYDRYEALSRSESAQVPAEHGSIWGQRLIALQLSALYFWTAVDKTDWAFISGQRLEQTFVWVHSGRSLEFLLEWPMMMALASVAVLVVEYWLAIAILLPKWRNAAIIIGLTMHASFYVLLPVNTYSITVMVLYLALLDPRTVHNFIDRMLAPTAKAEQ